MHPPHLCPTVFAIGLALTTDTDDEKGKNRERSHLWGSPIARGLSWVSLPHEMCRAVTSGPSKPQSSVSHDQEQAGYHPRASGLPTAREKNWAEDKSIIPFPFPEAPCQCCPMCEWDTFCPGHRDPARGCPVLPAGCHNVISACTPSIP